MAQPGTTQPLQERLLNLAKTPQFTWFTGHVLTLLGAVIHLLSTLLFRASTTSYKIAFAGALISYGLVVYKTHGIPRMNALYAQKLVMDENVQYLLLALYWFITAPISVALIPYATFSAFHALGYVRTSLIPAVYPAPSATSGAPRPWHANVQQQIKAWTDKNYSKAMQFVAAVEVVVIMGRLILGVFKFRIMPIFLYAQFLRFRYHLSTYTRSAFTRLRVQLDHYLTPPTADPRIPPAVTRAYITVKTMITRYGQAVVQPPSAGQ